MAKRKKLAYEATQEVAQEVTHVVAQPGEYGFMIARKHGITVIALHRLNPHVKDWSRIEGQKIRIK